MLSCLDLTFTPYTFGDLPLPPGGFTRIDNHFFFLPSSHPPLQSEPRLVPPDLIRARFTRPPSPPLLLPVVPRAPRSPLTVEVLPRSVLDICFLSFVFLLLFYALLLPDSWSRLFLSSFGSGFSPISRTVCEGD